MFVALTANDGVVKRTARETGIPESTIRRYRDDWAKNGPPPLEAVEEAVGDFLEDSNRVRNKALLEIERQIDARELKGAALVTAYGVITDKIDRARGLASARVEHTVSLPGREQLQELMRAAIEGAKQGAIARSADIVDAELVEQAVPALPPGRP